MSNISFLLGAGFSVNQGYPKAKDLSQSLVGLRYDDFMVSPAGTVGIFQTRTKDIHTTSSYKIPKICLLELIEIFNNKSVGDFNYEEFYDFLVLEDSDKFESDVMDIFNKHITKEGYYKDITNLRSDVVKIFTQIINWKISDKSDDKFYSSKVVSEFTKEQYKGFLNLIKNLRDQNLNINIHTLNHDLFLESLNYTNEFGEQISDGFTDKELYYEDSDGYEKNLSRFTNEYISNLRVFKLHGSFDIIPFHDDNGEVSDYIKYPWKTDLTNIKRRSSGSGKDHLDFSNYHSDFLSGTLFKISRYEDPIYFENMFKHFEQNLSTCDKLIIIGYGCLDKEINSMVEEKLKDGAEIYVVDPYPSDAVREFVKKTDAKLIEKTPKEIELIDFDLK